MHLLKRKKIIILFCVCSTVFQLGKGQSWWVFGLKTSCLDDFAANFRSAQVQVFGRRVFTQNKTSSLTKFKMSKTSLWHLHRLEGKEVQRVLDLLFFLLGWCCHWSHHDSFAIGPDYQNPASSSRPSDRNNKRYQCANINLSAWNYLQTQLVSTSFGNKFVQKKSQINLI